VPPTGGGTGEIAQTTFTVVDMKGAAGAAGPAGKGIDHVANNANGTLTLFFTDGTSFTTDNLTGPSGAAGPAGGLSIAAIILAVIALGWMVFGLLKKLLLK
jgi:hypothetical protein